MIKNIKTYTIIAAITFTGCTTIKQAALPPAIAIPSTFNGNTDTTGNPLLLKDFFADVHLQRLIDTALVNNFDIKVAMQRIEIAKAHASIANAARLPLVNAVAGVSLDRYGKYTLNGVGNFDTNLSPNVDKKRQIPTSLTPDYFIGFRSSWEVDIWGKLKDRKKAAYTRYLASQKGRQWLTTQIVSEVAGRYYELLALDNQASIIKRNIELQKRGLEVVEVQMEGGRATALAVRQFKAQILKTQGAAVEIEQAILQTENELNNLLGGFPKAVARDTSLLAKQVPAKIQVGLPTEVLLRRPDIQQAELELIAAKADISAARKAFLPSLNLNPYVGLNAFKVPLLFSAGSIAAGLATSLAAPVVNRRALTSGVNIANADQANAFYNYQRNIVQGYQEVVTQLQAIQNLQRAYVLKKEEVQTLTEGVATANDLYLAGYASYLEVIVAQGSVLQAEMEQVSLKRQVFNAIIMLYRSLGGGAN